MIKSLLNWYRRNESIRELSGLSDRELADLGIARGDINDVVTRAQMSQEDVVSIVRPRQTLSRLGSEKTANVVETFA